MSEASADVELFVCNRVGENFVGVQPRDGPRDLRRGRCYRAAARPRTASATNATAFRSGAVRSGADRGTCGRIDLGRACGFGAADSDRFRARDKT